LLAVANRNAFYYVIDRETGEFLSATPYAKQTWADGIDAKGRPILKPGNDPTVDGKQVWPNLQGSSNWYSPSYSPQTKLFYQFTREMSTIYYKGQAKYTTGQPYTAGGGTAVNGDDAYAAIRALEGTTGKLSSLVPGRQGRRWMSVSNSGDAEKIASRLRVNPEFAGKVYDTIAPGTTVIITDQPVVRKGRNAAVLES